MIAVLKRSFVEGEVEVSGAKNAFFPAVACGIALGAKKIKIRNVPKIKDVFVMLEILRELGCSFEFRDEGKELIIFSERIQPRDFSPELFGKIRGSVVIFGSLLSRFGFAKIPMPGGCKIGERPIDQHIKSARAFGFYVEESGGFFVAKGKTSRNVSFTFDIKTVTGTENAILMAIRSKAEINNIAIEPEVQELISYLKRYGVNIRREGDRVLIDGKEDLVCDEVEFELIPDRIEASTWLVLTASVGGRLKVKNVIFEHIEYVLKVLSNCGAKISLAQNSVEIESSDVYEPADIVADSFPAFPTDVQPQICVMLLKSKGISRVVDKIFPNRLSHIDELVKMGAKIELKGGEIIIYPSKIFGSSIRALDLRGAAALSIAGLMAESNSTYLSGFEFIQRGYENFVEKLRSIGGSIEVFEDDKISHFSKESEKMKIEQESKEIFNYVSYTS
jgi:UDP-N-acetylglucosamine 1-carboxyvinyltransferase